MVGTVKATPLCDICHQPTYGLYTYVRLPYNQIIVVCIPCGAKHEPDAEPVKVEEAAPEPLWS